MNELTIMTDRTYKAVYAIEFFARKTQASYALWAVKLRPPSARTYPKLPTGYGRCATLEQARLELTAYCEAQGLTFDDLRQDIIPWRLVKELLDGKHGAEYFARQVKRRPSAATQSTDLVNLLVFESGHKVWTDSLKVAERFGKRHDNVVQAIKNLPRDEFWLLNFKERDWIDDRGKTQPMIEMTWKGFSLLVMGFTGKAAYEWKVKFLDAFETMGTLIGRRKDDDWQQARLSGIRARRVLTDAGQALEEHASRQSGVTKNRNYYAQLTKLVYGHLFSNHRLKDIRDQLPERHLTFVKLLEESCAAEIFRMIAQDVEYHELFARAKQSVAAAVTGLAAMRLGSPEGAEIKLAWEIANG